MKNTDRICTINGCDILLQKGDCFSFYDPYIKSGGADDYVLIHDIKFDATRGYVVVYSRGGRDANKQSKDLDDFAKNIGYIARYNEEADNGAFKFIPIVSVNEKMKMVTVWRKIKNSTTKYGNRS